MRVLAGCILVLGIAVSPVLASPGGGGTTPANGATPAAPAAQPAGSPAPASPAVETELQQLRDLLESQAKQNQLESQELRDQLREQREKMQLVEQELKEAKGALEGEPLAAESAAGIGPSVAIANAAANSAAAQEKAGPPTAISYKGITITPGGFMVAETVWRQKALSADVNSPLNANPFKGSSNAHVGEWNASGRQSRISMLAEGKLDNVKIGGYYEMDFLSSGTTSNDNQSNSYTMRQRQFWAQAAFNSGWTFTGGQMWSLLTETTKGMDNRTEALPQVIDAQYVAGFSWARQFGFRVTKNFNNKVWLGFSVEEAQSTLTVHGNPTAQATGTTVACAPAGVGGCSGGGTLTINNNPTFVNFLVGQFGNGGGLYNATANYAYNRAPDLVFKAAFEPGFGHYEVFGVLSQFHDGVFPCVPLTGNVPPAGCASTTSATGAFIDSRTGGGGGGNARWSFLNKKVDFGLHGFAGTGIGRYGSAGLPDLTVRPNGTLVPLRNYQALATLQLHPTPKLDLNFYGGGEYSDRAQYIKSGAVPNVGYGAVSFNNSGCNTPVLPLSGPATNTNLGVPTGVGGSSGFITTPLNNCTGDTRNVIEGSFQFWYRFYRGPKGTIQAGMQYSNWVRNTWKGAGGIAPHSDNNMVFTSFRYYLP